MPKTKPFYVSESYKEYIVVNQQFADANMTNHEEDDVI